MTLLLDLADAARSSGLRVIELDDWQDNVSAGAFNPDGTLAHHTGSFDEVGDTSSDLAYAKWLAFTGRPDLDPPLCNLALSAECVVYVCSSGNANHAGQARASGPMPAASDGNALYIGIEAMNSGSQGWTSTGTDADGNEVTQYEAYVRLCAALAKWYGWPADHTRGHRETSVTGKIDPGGIDLDDFRTDIDNAMEDDMGLSNEDRRWFAEKLEDELTPIREELAEATKHRRKLAANLRVILREQFGATDEQLDAIEERLGEGDNP